MKVGNLRKIVKLKKIRKIVPIEHYPINLKEVLIKMEIGIVEGL